MFGRPHAKRGSRYRCIVRPRPPPLAASTAHEPGHSRGRAFHFSAYSLHLQRDGRAGTRSRCRHGSHYEVTEGGPRACDAGE